MKFLSNSLAFSPLLLCSIAFVGCGDSQVNPDATAQVEESEHDHAEHGHEEGEPETFSEAFKILTSMKTEICGAFAAETPEEAHDSLHDVGHLLEELPALAGKVDGISADQISKVEAAVEKLFDGFGQLDATMHGGPEVDVAELEKQLTAALGELEKAVP